MEFEKLIPDSEAIKETVEIGLIFERAAQTTEDRHDGTLPGVPTIRDTAV